MLIIVPPSEAKQPPSADGPPLDLEALSFPGLTDTRRRVLAATIETCAEPDALRRFHVGPRVGDEVRRNRRLHDLPTMPAAALYSGPFHETLAADTWSASTRGRAEHDLVIVSALWGALRPSDRIPPYRLHVCSRLLGLGPLEPLWRDELPGLLAEASGPRGVIVDLRSPTHQAMGRPAGLAERTVTVRVADASGDASRIGDVVSKRRRGAVARVLLDSAADPEVPEEVAAILGEHWRVDLAAPGPRTATWRLTVAAG